MEVLDHNSVVHLMKGVLTQGIKDYKTLVLSGRREVTTDTGDTIYMGEVLEYRDGEEQHFLSLRNT